MLAWSKVSRPERLSTLGPEGRSLVSQSRNSFCQGAVFGRAYHPRKCIEANLLVIAKFTRLFCLAANVAVDAGEPALLETFGGPIFGIVPERRWEGYPLFVDGEGLECVF